MQPESKNTGFMHRLKRFFLFGELIAGMALAASATQYYHINGNPASINSTTGELTDDAVDYLWVTKPPKGTAGLTLPRLTTTPQFDANGRTIVMLIDSNWPGDGDGLTKSHYRICSGAWSQAPQVTTPNIRYCGFALRFDANYGITNQGGGIGLWQAWQGHGWPPCQLRTIENNGNIRLYFLCNNDLSRGSENQYSSRVYLKDASGNDLIFQKDKWYSFVIQVRFDYTTASNALLNCWVNGNLAATWKGRMGYTPGSVSGDAGTLEGCDVHFGIYGVKTDALRKVYFSQIKLADNFNEAVPAALISPTPHLKTIVAESFGGAGAALHGTSADTFASGITSAGGSSTWIAHTNFLNNGAVLTGTGDGRCAGLNLGSYIDDAKNTFAGYFELTMTISPTVGPGWLSIGFAEENTINTNKNFTDTPAGSPTETGNATIIYRGNTSAAPYEVDMYGGPKLSNSIDGPTVSGGQTLTVALDLTPAGGYNGVNKFGRVIWMTNGVAMGSFTYTSDRIWGSLLVSQGSGNTGTISALTLAQSRLDIAVKANNTHDLDETTSWVLGNSPDNTTKIACWDDTVTSTNTVSLGTNTTWGGIKILNPSGRVTVNAGHTLTLGNALVDVDMSQASVDLILNCGVALGAANVWDVGSARTLTVGGVVSGSGTLTKAGPGTLTLSGVNGFTGTTIVNAGKLAIGNTAALLSTTSLTLADGTVLQPNLDGVVIGVPISVAGNGTISAPINAPGGGVVSTLTLNSVLVGSGNVTFSSSVNQNALSTVYVAGQSSYAGSTRLDTAGTTATQIILKLGMHNALPTNTVLTIDGQAGAGSGRFAELNLNGFNQQLAGLTNTARSLRFQRVVNSDVSAPATLTISNNSNYTFSGNLGSSVANGSVSAAAMAGSSNGNNFGLLKKGSGILNLTGSNSYTGNTTVNGGTLQILLPNLATNSTVSVAPGAVLRLDFTVTNTVASFITNGVPLAPGVYNAANAAPFLAGSGSLKVAGATPPPQPVIAPLSISGTNLVVSVPTVSGFHYVLQSATNLTPTINWSNESTNAGTGGSLFFNVPIEPGKPQKFLRFRVY
jgi:autotransporter-associated beta strand protein